MAVIDVRVDDWELRCRFNHGRYWERMQAGEFSYVTGKPGTPAVTSGQIANTKSQMVYYLDPATKQTIAKVHQFVRPDGTLGASGMPDPKMLVIGNHEYHKHKGRDESVRDASVLLPIGFQWTYRSYRKACCFLFGPERDKKMAVWITGYIQRKFGPKTMVSAT